MHDVETAIAAVKVHITGTDVPLAPVPRDAARKGVRTVARSYSMGDVINQGAPTLILAHAPNRKAARLWLSGTVAQVLIATSSGDASNHVGVFLDDANLGPVEFNGTDDIWIINTSNSNATTFVNVVAEYEEA